MSQLRGLGALTRAYLLETWRSKPAMFWNLLFPLFTLVGFSYIFGSGEPVPVARVAPGIMTINLLASAFFGISFHMVMLREKEIYRRFWATPVSPLAIVLAHAVTALVNIMLSAALQLLLAKVLFRMPIRGSLVEIAIAVLLGAFAFIPLGLLVGSVAQDTKTAPAISNLLFFPLSFLSGAAMPLYLMPAWLQKFATFLPATYLVELLQDVILRGHHISDVMILPAILILTGIVGFAFNAMLFRWESKQPVNRRGLALAVCTLVVIYGAIFLHGMKLESAHAPNEQSNHKYTADTRILLGMTILDGNGGRIEHGEVVLKGDRIVEVGPADGSLPKGVPVTDLSGLYMLPGLIDSHIHLAGSGGAQASSEEYAPQRLVHDLQVYLGLGITSILSLSDNTEDLQRLQRSVAAGTMRAPHTFLSGPVITAPGGHPAKLFAFMPGLSEYMTRQVDTPEAAEQAVREIAGMRVNIIKIFLEGGWSGESFPVLSEPCLKAAIRTAKELGLKTTVHVDNDAHARMAIAAGSDSIEIIPPDLSDETIKEMVSRGITLTPVLVASEGMAKAMHGDAFNDPLMKQWVDQVVLNSFQASDSWVARTRQSKANVDYYSQRYDHARESLRRAVAGHVTILAGSDAGNPGSFQGLGLLRELELLVNEGGMKPMDAIVAATGAAAKRLSSHDIGQIAPGTYADMLILEADPSKNISAIRNVKAVYFRGEQLQLDTLLSTRPGDWTPLFSFPSAEATPAKTQ